MEFRFFLRGGEYPCKCAPDANSWTPTFAGMTRRSGNDGRQIHDASRPPRSGGLPPRYVEGTADRTFLTMRRGRFRIEVIDTTGAWTLCHCTNTHAGHARTPSRSCGCSTRWTILRRVRTAGRSHGGSCRCSCRFRRMRAGRRLRLRAGAGAVAGAAQAARARRRYRRRGDASIAWRHASASGELCSA